MSGHTSFLTWIVHRRTRELCAHLDIELAEIISAKRGIRRYLELIPRTIGFLRAKRPAVLLVQSPSMVLAVLCVLLRPWFGFKLVFDAHNEAVEPYLHPSAAVRAVTYWLLRKADRVIVTNGQLATIVARHRGKPISLPDPPPKPPHAAVRPLPGSFRVTVISTFAGDEPLPAVLSAARALREPGFHFFVTGNPAKLDPSLRDAIPDNVTLTGFLAEPDYWSLLASSDAVLDLTTMDNCLVCGAYEAIAVDKPLVLSANAASIETFSGFAQFADNTAEGTQAALVRLRSEHSAMIRAMPELKAAFARKWAEQAAVLRSFIAQGSGSSTGTGA
jgi:glycosyl transferase family 4